MDVHLTDPVRSPYASRFFAEDRTALSVVPHPKRLIGKIGITPTGFAKERAAG